MEDIDDDDDSDGEVDVGMHLHDDHDDDHNELAAEDDEIIESDEAEGNEDDEEDGHDDEEGEGTKASSCRQAESLGLTNFNWIPGVVCSHQMITMKKTTMKMTRTRTMMTTMKVRKLAVADNGRNLRVWLNST